MLVSSDANIIGYESEEDGAIQTPFFKFHNSSQDFRNVSLVLKRELVDENLLLKQSLKLQKKNKHVLFLMLLSGYHP